MLGFKRRQIFAYLFERQCLVSHLIRQTVQMLLKSFLVGKIARGQRFALHFRRSDRIPHESEAGAAVAEVRLVGHASGYRNAAADEADCG